MLFVFAPFIVAIVFIVIAASSAQKRQKQAAEAQKQNREATVGSDRPPQPAAPRPAQRINPIDTTLKQPSFAEGPSAAPKPTQTEQKRYQTPVSRVAEQEHPEHDLCALRPEEHNAQESHADAKTQRNGGTNLNFNPENVLQGVVFSEILGKPKALR